MKNKLRIIYYTFLIILISCAILYAENPGVFNAEIGNYYFSRNDFQKAVSYWERAFDLGYDNFDLKEKYINYIITLPLTLENQEKLVNFAVNEENEPAGLTAKYHLQDLMMQIHKKYPLNYIQQASMNQKIIHWGAFPVTYKIKTDIAVPDEVINEIDNAFINWETASNGIVRFKKTNSDDADILVHFQFNNQNVNQGNYISAYTIPEIAQDKLIKMIITFYLQTPDGKYFSLNQIYNTALHEIFHALGFMGHSFNRENIMYMSKNSRVNGTDEREVLNKGDITTLELLYKIKPDVTNKDDLKYEYVPYLVIGDNYDIHYAKQKSAKDYIRKAPDLPNGYIDLAESYVAQKNYPQAVKNLEKALKLAQNDDTRYVIYYNLAISNFYMENYDAVLSNVQEGRKIKDTPELHYVLALAYTKKNEIKDAISEYILLIQESPENIDYAVDLTNLYIKNHNYISARRTLKNFIAKNPAEKNNPKLKSFGFLGL